MCPSKKEKCQTCKKKQISTSLCHGGNITQKVKDDEERVLVVFRTNEHSIFCEVTVDGSSLMLFGGTGFSVFLLPWKTYDTLLRHVPLQSPQVALQSYSRDVIPVPGVFEATICFGIRGAKCTFYVLYSGFAIVVLNMQKAIAISLGVAHSECKEVKATAPSTIYNFLKQYAAVFFYELALAK